jgi:Gpi18-like mannosyltransferase
MKSTGAPLQTAMFAGLFLLAMAVRVALFPFITGDYTAFLSPWYDFIRSHGGFAALRYDFANYNPPYLYLLALATYLPLSKIVAIKLISVLFDLLLAYFAYLLLRLKYRHRKSRHSALPWIGAIVILFAPTIAINSAAWGQCDAIYTAFCLGSLYFLLSKRPLWAAIFFGIAISFKLQAIFFAPILLLFVLKGEMPWYDLLAIPLVALLLLLPAYFAGRDAMSLLTVYVEQVDTGGIGGGGVKTPNDEMNPPRNQTPRPNPFSPNSSSPNPAKLSAPLIRQRAGAATLATPRPDVPQGEFRGSIAPVPRSNSLRANAGPTHVPRANAPRGGLANILHGGDRFNSLTYNAPSIYQWLGDTPLANNTWLGVTLAALALALAGMLLFKSGCALSEEVVMNCCLLCLVVIPFLLPKMHERYFYMADAFTILYAFYYPRAFYIPILMQVISLLSYAPFLLGFPIVDLRYVAVLVLALAIIAWVKLARSAFRAGGAVASAPA